MNVVFADTFYYLSLINESDQSHAKAVSFMSSFRGSSITTEWILTELGDALARPQKRSAYLELLESIRHDPLATVVESSRELFTRGVALYAARPDKGWSLTDCISFVVMEAHGIREALTGDQHFEQAGYVALLA